MPRNTEIELKLTLPPNAEKALLSHPRFGVPLRGAKSQRLVTTYFDTPQRDLKRQGLTLRVRRAGDERIQTVKLEGEAGAAQSRGEWECPVETDSPDIGRLKHILVAERLADVERGRRLQPAVVTDIVRRKRVVQIDDSSVEFSLDSGTIAAGENREPVHELELELLGGRPGALYRFALDLHAAIPVEIEAESKAARGFRLKDGSQPPSRKFSPPEFPQKVRSIEGLCAIVGRAIGNLSVNRASALSGDAEGIHQTRIAIRRLRSALQLFGPTLDAHTSQLFNDRLRDVGRAIGVARDWDVFCEEIAPKAFEESSVDVAQAVLVEASESKRAAAHEACGRALKDPATTGLALGLVAWLETGREERRLVGDKLLRRKLVSVAPKLLGRLDRKAVRRGKAVESAASAEDLHPLRKSLKKMRYSAEFVGSLYERRAVKRFLKRLEKLQDSLGAINDAAMGARLTKDLVDGGHMELAPSAAAIAASQARRRRKAMKKLPKQWNAYCEAPRFWA